MFSVTTVVDFRREARERHVEILKAQVDAAFDAFLVAVGAQVRAGDVVNDAHKVYLAKQMELNRWEERSRG